MTFVAALRFLGLTASFVLDGPINKLSFEAHVEQVLVPASSRAMWSSWTTSTPTKAAASASDRKAGAHVLILAANSLHLKPIEPAFAKFNSLLQNAEERAVK